MNRKIIAALAAATLASAALAGCVMQTPEPAPPPAAPSIAPAEPAAPTTAPAEPAEPAEPAAAPPIDREEAFLDAIASGFVVADLPRSPLLDAATAAELRSAVFVAADATCAVLAEPNGRAMAIIVAEQNLADRETFTAAMPVLFVDAAAEHICP